MRLDERAWWTFQLAAPPDGIPWPKPCYVTDGGYVGKEDRAQDRFCGTEAQAMDEAVTRSQCVRLRGFYNGTVVPVRVEGVVEAPATDAEVLAEVARILRTPAGENVVEHALAVRRLADLGAEVVPLVVAFRAEGGS
jgi:hypothetical protein